MMMSSQLRHTMALVVIEVAIMMTSSQLRHLVVIVYKWKRSDNESEERRGQFKVPGKFAPYVSYHRPGRERRQKKSGEGRVRANREARRERHGIGGATPQFVRSGGKRSSSMRMPAKEKRRRKDQSEQEQGASATV